MRIVGVTGTNVLNYYYVSLNSALASGCGKLTPNAKGEVAITTDPAEDVFCIEPVKKIVSATALTEDIYFVPAYDFEKITVNGSDVDTSSITGDDVSLYKLTAGATISKISL